MKSTTKYFFSKLFTAQIMKRDLIIIIQKGRSKISAFCVSIKSTRLKEMRAFLSVRLRKEPAVFSAILA